jgi:hypothetical protein
MGYRILYLRTVRVRVQLYTTTKVLSYNTRTVVHACSTIL